MPIQRKPMYPAYKSPDSSLEYGMDWANVVAVGDEIVQSQWVSDANIFISNTGIRGTITYCTISGGEIGKQYKVFNKITTADGFIDERFFVLKVQDIQVSFCD